MTGTVDEADLIAGIVTSCEGVASMSAASRTYLPGRTVLGVQIGTTGIDVHVIVFYGISIPELAARISARLAGTLSGRSVTVHVQDIVMPGQDIALPGQGIITPHQPIAVPATPLVIAKSPASPTVLPPLATTAPGVAPADPASGTI